MAHHSDLNDAEFETQFENCTLNPELFSHEAHLRLAWIHVRKYGMNEAENNVSKQLIQFVTHLGARQKYNHTLTIAAVKAVAHFVNKSHSDNFSDFIIENPRLKFNFRDLMAFHYGVDIFNSIDAKEKFLEPDLVPFD